MPYSPGDILLDKYRLEALIGEGAYAQVYRALHLRPNFPRALKILHKDKPGLGSTEYTEYRGRFGLEAQLGAKLNHPNIVQVYDFEQDGVNLILTMEYAAGGSLGKVIEQARQTGKLPPIESAVRLAIDIAEGLSAIHALDVVHRDLKPNNILLDEKGHAKIADLGLAQVPGGPSLRSQLSTPAPHPGTPGYMSPEQVNATGYLTPASDVFGVGLVLFELLTGRVYHNQRPGTSAGSLRTDLPDWLDALLAQMLSDLPEKRPWDGKELAQLLRLGDTKLQPSQSIASTSAGPVTSDAAIQNIVQKTDEQIVEASVVSRSPIREQTPVQTVTYEQPVSSPKRVNWLAIGLGAGLVGMICLGMVILAFLKFPSAPVLTAEPEIIAGATQPPTVTPTAVVPPPVVLDPTFTPTFAPTSASPTELPPASDPLTGQRIAYAGGGEQAANRSIFIKYLDGSRPDERFTAGTADYGDNFPTFSPDGSTLAFARCYQKLDDGCDLFIQSLSGGQAQKVLTGHKVMRPKWCGSVSSSYRDWVVFEYRRKNGSQFQDQDSFLGMVNTATGEFKQLTSGASDWSPNWSPDCATLVFTHYPTSSGLVTELTLLDLATGQISTLLSGTSASPPAGRTPAWSPDGQWIAYRTTADTNGDGFLSTADHSDLWLIRSNGSDAHPMLVNSYNVASLSWAPDNQHLILATQDNRLVVCDLQGNFLADMGAGMHPDWAP